MACRLSYSAQAIIQTSAVMVNWTLRNKIQWNFDQNTRNFIYKNASQNIICEMAAFFVQEGDEFRHAQYICRGTSVNHAAEY